MYGFGSHDDASSQVSYSGGGGSNTDTFSDGGGGGGGGQDRGGMQETLDNYRAEQAARQAESDRQAQAAEAEAAAQAAAAEAARQEQARKQAAAAQAEAARQAQLQSARDQASSFIDRTPQFPDSRNLSTREGTLSDFLGGSLDRGLYSDFSKPLTEDDLNRIPGSYDPKADVFDEEGDFLTDNRDFTQSEYERIAGITDTDPFGNNPVAGSSTAFGRGIAQFANKLGSVIGTDITVDKRGNLTKGQQDFIRNNAYDRYKEPYGPAKMFSTMRNFNLSPAEKAEYERQQVLQQTSTPSRVVTYADKARQLGEDPSRYEQPNTIRSGLSEGDLTTLGRVVGRPRDMSDSEMVARFGIAATPLGLPLAAAENIFGLNRELGIEGQLGPDGKPFVSAPGQGGLGQLFNVATGGAGTRALDRASEIATNLINPRAGTESAFGGVDDFGNKPPSFFERYFGGGSGGSQSGYPEGGGANEGGEPNVSDAIISDPEGPEDGTTSDNLFAQETYKGPKGGFIFDPVANLPEVYARRSPRILPMSFGLGGIPTRRMANGGYMGFGGSGYGSSGGILGQLDQLGDMSSGFSTELNQLVNGGGQSSNLAFNADFSGNLTDGLQNFLKSEIPLQGGPQSGPISSRPASNNMVSPIGGGQNEFISYHKLPDGTGMSYDRRTRAALPPGAVGVSYDEYINLPKQEKRELLSAGGGGLFGGGLEAYTGGSSTFDESAPYNPSPQPISFGIGSTTYGY